jgi:tripartite-type tricarboxylate transporter receptor subunit TctC
MQRHVRHGFALALVAVAVSMACGLGASAQSGRTIKIVLPFAPGGPAYALARILADEVGVQGGPTVVVENRPGAGTEIGTDYVARADPDGNTLGMVSNSLVVLPHLRKVAYDPFADFAPICELATFPPLIVVNPDSPYHSLADFINDAHAHPGKLTMASNGPGTSSQIAVEMLKQAAKIDITFIPYPGYTPAIAAVLGNQVTSALADYSELHGQLESGKLRALATTLARPIPTMPDVPTVADSGYKGFEAEFFAALIAPAKTPPATISDLERMFTAAMEPADVKKKLAALGLFPAKVCGADFSALLHKQYDQYGQIIREAKIELQ